MSMIRGLQRGGKYKYIIPLKYYIRTQDGIRINNNNFLDAGTWLTNSEYARLFR